MRDRCYTVKSTLVYISFFLGLSDEGVENLSYARSRIRSFLNAAEKMSNWSPGKVRYFSVSEGFSTLTSLGGVHECPSKGATFRDHHDGSYATLNRYCLRPKDSLAVK